MPENIRTLVKERLNQIGGCVALGESASHNWVEDPARVLFSLSRYKFVAKMFSDYENVLEVGCADGLGAYLVSRNVRSITCVDIDTTLIASAKESVSSYATNMIFETGNVLKTEFLHDQKFNGIFLLDVLEHISVEDEDNFIHCLCERLAPFGSMIIGMPSQESQIYASRLSKIGHINCKTQPDFLAFCQRHFHITYMFGANDEVIHTGYAAMQHYRIALCAAPKTVHPDR